MSHVYLRSIFPTSVSLRAVLTGASEREIKSLPSFRLPVREIAHHQWSFWGAQQYCKKFFEYPIHPGARALRVYMHSAHALEFSAYCVVDGYTYMLTLFV